MCPNESTLNLNLLTPFSLQGSSSREPNLPSCVPTEAGATTTPQMNMLNGLMAQVTTPAQ